MVRPCGRLSALPDGFQAARQGRRAASHSRSCRAAPGYRGEGPPLRLADPIPEKPICVTIGEALDFGPFFLKFCAYFPYNAKLCINGHEYLKRQLAKRRVAFEALDNGIKSCADPTAAETERRADRREDRSAIAQMAATLATSVSHVCRLAEREFSATQHTSITFQRLGFAHCAGRADTRA